MEEAREPLFEETRPNAIYLHIASFLWIDERSRFARSSKELYRILRIQDPLLRIMCDIYGSPWRPNEEYTVPEALLDAGNVTCMDYWWNAILHGGICSGKQWDPHCCPMLHMTFAACSRGTPEMIAFHFDHLDMNHSARGRALTFDKLRNKMWECLMMNPHLSDDELYQIIMRNQHPLIRWRRVGYLSEIQEEGEDAVHFIRWNAIAKGRRQLECRMLPPDEPGLVAILRTSISICAAHGMSDELKRRWEVLMSGGDNISPLESWQHEFGLFMRYVAQEMADTDRIPGEAHNVSGDIFETYRALQDISKTLKHLVGEGELERMIPPLQARVPKKKKNNKDE